MAHSSHDTKTAKTAVIGLNIAAIVLSLLNAVLIALRDSFNYKERAGAYLKAVKDFDEAYNLLLYKQAEDDMNEDDGPKDRPFVGAVKEFIDTFGTIAKEANVGHAIGLVDSKDWVIADLKSKIAELEKKEKEEPTQSQPAPGSTDGQRP